MEEYENAVDEFLKFLVILGGAKMLADAIRNVSKLSPEMKEINRLFGRGEFRVSVIESFIALENRLKLLCQVNTGKDHSKDELNKIIILLKEKGVISEENYYQLHYFRKIRNSMFHSNRNISKDEARNLITSISKFLK